MHSAVASGQDPVAIAPGVTVLLVGIRRATGQRLWAKLTSAAFCLPSGPNYVAPSWRAAKGFTWPSCHANHT